MGLPGHVLRLLLPERPGDREGTSATASLAALVAVVPADAGQPDVTRRQQILRGGVAGGFLGPAAGQLVHGAETRLGVGPLSRCVGGTAQPVVGLGQSETRTGPRRAGPPRWPWACSRARRK